MDNNAALESQFHLRLLRLAEENSKVGVRGDFITSMVANRGAVEAARIMVNDKVNPPPPAVATLLLLGRPELTVEYVIANGPEWALLYPDDFSSLQERSRGKLVEWGFRI